MRHTAKPWEFSQICGTAAELPGPLEGCACLALAHGHAARALSLAAAAAHSRKLISAPLPQAEQLKLDQTLQPAWKSLTGPDGKSAWAKGSAMDMEKAVQYSLQEPESATPV